MVYRKTLICEALSAVRTVFVFLLCDAAISLFFRCVSVWFSLMFKLGSLKAR